MQSHLERSPAMGAIALLAATLLCATAPAAFAGPKNPYLRANGTWISISGEVKDVQADRFDLDYGDGSVLVEMDDGDRDADGYKLLEGDKVTVHGRIDDDFYETTKIEAGSVYVEKLGTYFYASSTDEEDFHFASIATPVVVSSTTVRGVVTGVDGREFTLDTGIRQLRVDTSEMPYDPLDDMGYQQIRKGDYVKVHGELDASFFEGRELIADAVIELAG